MLLSTGIAFIGTEVFAFLKGLQSVHLIATDSYPLVNGYGYGVIESGDHRLIGRRSIELGYHLQSLYFDDRFIIGEVIEWPYYQDRPYGNKHSYFIFDTETGKYLPGLTTPAFKAELEKLGISENIELSKRSDRNWLKQQTAIRH